MEEKLCISGVEPQKKKKDRYNIYIDGEYAASLGAHAVVTHGIKEGAIVGAQTLKDAVFEDNKQYAFDTAVGLLAHKMRTRAELEDRLKERGIAEEAVVAALEKLAEYGYVNDADYAREYVLSAVQTGRWGRKAVEYRLKEKGLEQSVVAKAMQDYTEEDEREIARAQMASLNRSSGADARKQRQRIYASLMRHGFDYGVISGLLSEDEE